MRKEKGSSLLEAALMLPVVLVMIMAIFQYAVFVTISLATNYAAYRAGRALLVSMHNAPRYGQTPHSAVRDAQTAAMSVALSVKGWALPYFKVSVYKYDSGSGNKMGQQISGNSLISPDQDVWVVVTGYARLVIPLGRFIFGNAVPGMSVLPQGDFYYRWFNPESTSFSLLWLPVRASYLVHTPSQKEP